MTDRLDALETILRKMISGLRLALAEYASDTPVEPAFYCWWEQPKPSARMHRLTGVPRRKRFFAVEQVIIKDKPDVGGLVLPELGEPVGDGVEQVNFVVCDRKQNLAGVGVTVRRTPNEPPRVERALKADALSGGAVECLKRGMMLAHALDGDDDVGSGPPSAGP